MWESLLKRYPDKYYVVIFTIWFDINFINMDFVILQTYRNDFHFYLIVRLPYIFCDYNIEFHRY